MHTVNFEEVLEKIVAHDERYHRPAYFFLREALDFTQKKIGREHQSEPRHVTAQELLGGIRDFALLQFGPMTLTVLGEWGIHRGEDFGEIVFNMVENNLLAKTEGDRREDFQNGYDFHEAFQKPFLPAKKVRHARSFVP